VGPIAAIGLVTKGISRPDELVPLPARKSPEGDQANQRDYQPEQQAPEDRDDDPDDDDDASD
jgi:hypothetical protein